MRGINGLNDRQIDLYMYLLGKENEWSFQEDIAYALPHWYCPTTNGDFHNTKERNLMTKDIRAINDCPVIEKIIISNPSRGIKLATESEWEECIKREYASVFKKLKRIRAKERKGILNNQTRLVFKSERDTIEAFLQEG